MLRLLIMFCVLCQVASAQSFLMSSDNSSFVVSSSDHVGVSGDPFSYSEPVTPVEPKITVQTAPPRQQAVQPVKTSSEDLIALHNRLHGGGGLWKWPGYPNGIEQHLREVHNYTPSTPKSGASTLASIRTSTVSSNCPNGVCPTRQPVFQTTPRRRGLFGRRR